MQTDDHIAVLERHAAALTAAVARDGALDRPVAARPGRTVADVVTRLGHEHALATVALRRRGERPGDDEADAPGGDLPAWWRRTSMGLVTRLRATDPAAPCWTPAGGSDARGVAWRLAHETVIGRWDVEHAVGGQVTAIEPEVAADGVTEFVRDRLGGAWPGDPGVVALRAADTGQEWIVGAEAGAGVRWLRDKRLRPLDAVVSAPAADVYLALWRRAALDPAAVDGDADLMTRLLAAL